ncbi:MAG: PLDc N-terminal domain-containing protein [Cyclobacteriaceae bacterium]
MNIQFILGPFGVIFILLIYLSLTLSALFIMFKKEQSYELFLWFLVIVFLPFIGSLLYLFKHIVNSKTTRN